jgi:hypothetical protein
MRLCRLRRKAMAMSPVFRKYIATRNTLALCRRSMVIFTLFFCSYTECSSLAAAASRRHRHRSGQLPGTTMKYVRRRSPPSYGRVSIFSKVLRRKGYISSVQMKLVINPTHKQTEGRAPVWGSEFTSKDTALQGESAKLLLR